MKPSEDACKIFFNHLKMCYQIFTEKVHFLPPQHASRWFLTNSNNIVDRNPSMVIPLLASQELTFILMQAHLYFNLKCFSDSSIT